MSTQSSKLSVIIVNYNSTIQLNSLIKSLQKINDIIQEIFIIDNNSNDLNKLDNKNSKITLVKNDQNVGFAKAVNQGVKITKSDYILLLNPDTLILDNSIKILFDEIKKNKSIGAIGGKIQHKNNNKPHFTATSKINFFTGLFEFTNLKKIFPNNTFTNKFWIEKNSKIIRPIKVYSLCGAFILFRKKLNDQLNLFDESFFLYLEDIMFGININKKGYSVIFDPRAKVEHIGGVSSASKYNTVLKHWYKSRKILFKKLCNPITSCILNLIFTLEELSLKIYHHLKHEPAE